MAKRRNWEEVGEIIKKIAELGLSYKQGACQFGIKPWVLYDYNRRQKDANGDPAQGGSVGGHSKKGSVFLPDEVQKLIGDYRREHPNHGFKRIQDELKKKHLLVVTRKQIRSVLKNSGLLEVLDSSFDRKEPAKGTRRFEAGYPDARRGIEDYIHSYNFERPHQGIQGALPSERFYGVSADVGRAESGLLSKGIDLSKGYLVYKIHDHALSVVFNAEGLQVFLDGRLLKEDSDHGTLY